MSGGCFWLDLAWLVQSAIFNFAVVVLRLGVLGLGLCGEDQLLSHLQPDQAEIYSDDIVIIISPAVPGMLSI